MILANKEFVELSRTRIEKRKLVLVTMKSARENIGEAYRNLVTLINSQIMVQNLKDEESGGEEDRPGELSVLVDTPEDPYTDFVRSLNVLIKDYNRLYKTLAVSPRKNGRRDSQRFFIFIPAGKDICLCRDSRHIGGRHDCFFIENPYICTLIYNPAIK